MTTLTPSRSRALLRRAVALLDGYEDYPLHEQWTEARAAFLADVAVALGVTGTQEAIAALTPKGTGKRGPDRGKRRRPGERTVALSPESDVGSRPSQLDRPNPSARSNDDGSDVDQIAAVHTLSALRFQQMSL